MPAGTIVEAYVRAHTFCLGVRIEELPGVPITYRVVLPRNDERGNPIPRAQLIEQARGQIAEQRRAVLAAKETLGLEGQVVQIAE